MGKTWILNKLLQDLSLEKTNGDLLQNIRGVDYDSRRVNRDFLFAAIPGIHYNGADFIEEAISRGAKAILTQEDLIDRPVHKGVSYIRVRDSREALSKISAAFYDFPSRQLKVIGITGTNGKTSTTYLLESILKAAHFAVGVIGTVNYRIRDRIIPSVRTTPESLELQFLLKEMVEAGITHVIMEVSSHALTQRRVSQIDFDIGLFTNLSQDHLDYHKTMGNYFASKNLLFESLGRLSQKNGEKYAIVNGDDQASTGILKTLENSPGVKILSFGLGDKNLCRAEAIESKSDNNRFIISYPSADIEVNLSLFGRHNVYNALAAASCGFSLDIEPGFIKEGLEKLKNIPGRFEFIGKHLPFEIVVDYAHTEAALRNILESAGKMSPKRIILVFGCGGDRDKGKRPLMGKAAEELADFSILTSDNPRSEEPEEIINHIKTGFTLKRNYQVILDRYQAIESAIKKAVPGDMIIIAGKGHETYQIYKDGVEPFDDRKAVEKILRAMGISGAQGIRRQDN